MSATDDVGDGDDGCPGSEFTGGGSQDVRGLALVLVDVDYVEEDLGYSKTGASRV